MYRNRIRREKSYIAVIGSVTLSIVLLNHDSLDEAILRIFNIIIGIVGSMVMMRFFFPQYAKNEITDMQAKFIKQLSSMLISYLDPIKSLDTMKQEYLEHEHRLLTDFNTFNRLISEAKIETRKTPDFVQYHLSAMQHIRHIFRLMSVFICYLTTDEIRVNPWVCENLRQLLIAMQGVQQALSERTTHDLPEPLEDQIQDDTLQVILTDIHHELALFAENIKHIVRISNTWKGRPHDSKA